MKCDLLVVRFVLGLVVLGVGVGSVCAQNAPPPIEPARLPVDWAERDLEGKWVAFRNATGTASGDPRGKTAWVMALRTASEFELLEWIAVFEGWRQAGPELVKADAPQLMRAAAWNLGALDSHNKDNAENAMQQRGGLARGWFEAHPLAQRGKGAAIYRLLVEQNHEPADAARYLPPLDAMQVLVPWLDAPAEVADFADRRTAEPKVRYAHQVLRALDGVLAHGQVDEFVVQKVVGLVRHRDAGIRNAAVSTLSGLPAGRVPYPALLRLADDAALDGPSRQATTMALSFSSHPEAFFALHRIAADPLHPAREAAVIRLGELGDDTTVAALLRIDPMIDPAIESSIGAQLNAAVRKIAERKRSLAFLQPVPLRVLLTRVAWLRATGDVRAEPHAQAAAALLASLDKKGGLIPALDQMMAAPAPAPAFPAEEAERVDKKLVEFVGELRLRGGK